MKILNKALDDKKFDVRMMHKNLQRNLIQYEDVKKYYQSLPDDASQAEYTKLDASLDSGQSIN